MCDDSVDCKHLAKGIPKDETRDNRIMRTLIMQKFSMPKFKEFLKGTGSAKLLECNPHDTYWSTGSRLDDDVQRFRGENMLGQIIQDFRKTLK